MKLTKKMITLTTILLTFALLLTSAPLGVIAQGTDTLTEDATPPQTKQAQATDATELAPVVSEVIDRREETVKHFDMGDGTFRAVSYGYPVHKRDAGGTWQSIDNTLLLLSGATYYGTADARVQFAKSPSTGTFLIRIAENGYKIKTTC